LWVKVLPHVRSRRLATAAKPVTPNWTGHTHTPASRDITLEPCCGHRPNWHLITAHPLLLVPDLLLLLLLLLI
jgi:hypothetical protein